MRVMYLSATLGLVAFMVLGFFEIRDRIYEFIGVSFFYGGKTKILRAIYNRMILALCF
jgi:hypothetical protein